MTELLTDSVTLSRAEFALLGQLGAGQSLIEEWAEPLDEMSWAVVFDGLLARGVLAWDPARAADVLTAHWRPVVEPVIAPLFAVNATASRPEGPVHFHAIVGQSSAVEHAPEPDGLHRVTVVDRSGLTATVTSLLGLDEGPVGAEGQSVSVPLDQLEAAVTALGQSGPKAAAALMPDCLGYADALAAAQGANVIEVRQLDDERQLLSGVLTWIDGGEHGCWTAVAGDGSVALRQVRRPDMARQVASALTVAG